MEPEITPEMLELGKYLLANGIMGAVLYWFMIRNEKKSDTLASEVRNMSKSISALATTMLMDILSKNSIAPDERIKMKKIFTKILNNETINPEDLQ